MSGQVQRVEGAAGSEEVMTMRGPAVRRHQMLAELRAMQLRGEISYAFNLRQEPGGVVAVSFVRLRAPRSRTPRYVTAFCAATGALVGLGGMVYHSRHVIAGLAMIIMGGFAVLALVWLLAAIARATGSSAGHCPGAWHR